MGRLEGKHALVTGASRGIGLAIAKALAAEGARLTLVGRSPTRLQQASAACRQAGAPLTDISPRDLTQRGSLSGLVSGPAAKIDILVNNAGAAPTAPLERTDDVLWDDTFALNVFVPFALCRVAVPAMLERGFGRVINLASTAALQGFAYTSAYTASKHALLGLTRALDAELSQRSPDRDVTVNAICPGFVDTDILKPTVLRLVKTSGCTEAEARQQLGSMNPGGRLLTPAEVADAVLALACEQPGTTRGAAVVLDGTLR
ncbi:MAG: SDR family NAD(P)-dependent oxidoreductase [Planctomycetota bacterium]